MEVIEMINNQKHKDTQERSKKLFALLDCMVEQ